MNHLRVSSASRRLIVAVAALAVAAPFASAASADLLPSGMSDVGVRLQVAQATATGSGATSITYQGTATVAPGRDTLLRGQVFNDGSLPELSAQLVVATGSKLDPAFAIDPATCPSERTTQDAAGNDVVTCTYSGIAAGASEPWVNLAVATGGSPSITSVASETATPDSAASLGAQDSDETATVVTTVSGNEFAFLTDGQSLKKTTPDGAVTESMSLPAGATGGGGVFVNLTENATTGTCGGFPCSSPMAEIDWVQVGGTNNPPAATNPFQTTVSYNTLKQSCNGIGGPSGCVPLYFRDPGMTAFSQVPQCTSYVPNTGTPVASSDPCIYTISKNTGGAVTYFLASLKDQLLPVQLGG